MSDERESIFRREALDFRAGVREERAVLQLGGPWSTVLYWLVLVLGLTAVAIGWTVRADETTSGPALLDARAGTFIALLPAATGPELAAGQPARLELSGPGGRTVAARVATAEVTDADGARRAGFPSASGPAVLVTGALEGQPGPAVPPSGRQTAQAVIVVHSDRLIRLLLDGVGALFGKGGDG